MTSPLPAAEEVIFILQVKVTFAPADRDTFLQHFKTIYELVSAEPECAYFIVGEDVQVPGTFRWTEGWTRGVEWFMTVCVTMIMGG